FEAEDIAQLGKCLPNVNKVLNSTTLSTAYDRAEFFSTLIQYDFKTLETQRNSNAKEQVRSTNTLDRFHNYGIALTKCCSPMDNEVRFDRIVFNGSLQTYLQ
ncbi:hypothetical protein STEG23_023446, partial [Scotinomys teguina]